MNHPSDDSIKTGKTVNPVAFLSRCYITSPVLRFIAEHDRCIVAENSCRMERERVFLFFLFFPRHGCASKRKIFDSGRPTERGVSPEAENTRQQALASSQTIMRGRDKPEDSYFKIHTDSTRAEINETTFLLVRVYLPFRLRQKSKKIPREI